MVAPLRGRLTVGRLTLDQEVGVRIPAPQLGKVPLIHRFRCGLPERRRVSANEMQTPHHSSRPAANCSSAPPSRAASFPLRGIHLPQLALSLPPQRLRRGPRASRTQATSRRVALERLSLLEQRLGTPPTTPNPLRLRVTRTTPRGQPVRRPRMGRKLRSFLRFAAPSAAFPATVFHGGESLIWTRSGVARGVRSVASRTTPAPATLAASTGTGSTAARAQRSSSGATLDV